jgi:hypothetical protein
MIQLLAEMQDIPAEGSDSAKPSWLSVHVYMELACRFVILLAIEQGGVSSS